MSCQREGAARGDPLDLDNRPALLLSIVIASLKGVANHCAPVSEQSTPYAYFET
jgi:hypothetical protein